MPNKLSEYRRKRDFAATPEPAPASGGRSSAARDASPQRYMIHLHHARSRHFDLRLQLGDTLRSWAVPKGPSLDPRNKRLAVEVEDHPLDYGSFEGTIPEGHYGAGKVWIWDEGLWLPQGDPGRSLKQGRLHFSLQGRRMTGGWSLVRTHLHGKQPQWLLMKSPDEAARSGDEADDTPLSQWIGQQPAAGKKPKAAKHAASADKTRRKARSQRSALPASIGLQLARLTPQAPQGGDWLHEEKFDGYRVLLWRNGKDIRITSRGDQDWSDKLPGVVRAMRALSCKNCILDGELVALDSAGHSNFGLLQKRFGEQDQRGSLWVMVFDLLHIDGEDLRPLPQIERKQKLAALLADAAAPLRATTFVTGHGPQLASEACAHGLEGIVSKAASAAYEDGRSNSWLKTKCVQSDEYAVIGYTTGKGSRATLGSLLLATPEPGRGTGWRYSGRLGAGFDDETIRDLLLRFKPAAKPKHLENAPGRAELRGAKPIWVKPALVVEAEFRGLTEDGLLRQASLKGLRRDRSIRSLKPAQRNTARAHSPLADAAPPEAGMPASSSRPSKRSAGGKSSPAGGHLTHPERVLFKKPRITKQDLANFYSSIADFILPGLVQRPLLLMRCPDGGAGACFFQKHLSPGFPRSVREVMDPTEKTRWVYIDGLDGLLGLVQMNCLEFHVWGSTVAELDLADRLVMDLDPADDVPWKAVVKCAMELRQRLQSLQLQSFVRTSGGKGLHLVIPLQPAVDWDTAKSFAHALADTLAREQPERYVSVASKAKRGGRIFLDYLRNGRGATAAASYSLRNRPGAPMVTPLSWDELPRLRSPQQYGYDNIRRRLSRLGADPWIGIDRMRQSLPAVES